MKFLTELMEGAGIENAKEERFLLFGEVPLPPENITSLGINRRKDKSFTLLVRFESNISFGSCEKIVTFKEMILEVQKITSAIAGTFK